MAWVWRGNGGFAYSFMALSLKSLDDHTLPSNGMDTSQFLAVGRQTRARLNAISASAARDH
jgi:hypothetical protein